MMNRRGYVAKFLNRNTNEIVSKLIEFDDAYDGLIDDRESDVLNFQYALIKASEILRNMPEQFIIDSIIYVYK